MVDQAKRREGNFFNRWGAVVILVVLFFCSWSAQFVAQMHAFSNEQAQAGNIFTWQEFMPEFLSSTFENWQSEWLQLAAQGLLIAGFSSFIFSKQNEEHYKTQQMIARLQADMQKLAKQK